MTSLLDMDPVQAILAQTALKNSLFPPNSRYYGIDTATFVSTGAPPIVYLRRRFLPAGSTFQVIQEHTVKQAERLDQLSAQFLGDPTLFWRLCDANGALRPEELTETVGRTLRITLPAGIAGSAL